ncbi:MAG: lipoate--protein ligase family protein [Chloroflexi bacterium]|nr:MAG: lipoate--protein ligase family protein [Chloroflexota bacterium]
MGIAPYRFINTGVQDAAYNMAIDESILLHHIRGEVPPTLRVFRWSQPAISLGRFQSIEREIALATCQQRRIALVRRPTGGRAVYHRDEFTYSIVMGKQHGIPSGVVAAYVYLAQGLLAALQILGVQATLSDERAHKNPSAACFASSTKADLTYRGYKLIGSAQVWKDEALLQQGSFPLEDRAAEFFAFLQFPTEEACAEALLSYQAKTAPLHTFVPAVSWDEVAAAFQQGCSRVYQPFVTSELSRSEWDLARQLVEEKYSKLSWRKEKIVVTAQGPGHP